MSIFLTWGNARGKFPHPFFRLWMAHISVLLFHCLFLILGRGMNVVIGN